MGWLGGLLGSKSSGPKVTDVDRATLDIKKQRDKLLQFQKRLNASIGQDHSRAKLHLANGDRQRALIYLRKKKVQQQSLLKTDQQIANMEETLSNIDMMTSTAGVVEVLEKGNAVLKQLNRETSIDRVERVMDETAEGIAYQKEVTEMLAGKITYEDETEIEEELAMIEQQETGTKTVDKQPLLPEVPKGVLEDPTTAGEQELESEADPEPERTMLTS